MSMLPRTFNCLTAPGLWLLFSCIVATLGQSEGKAVFALGSRILDDQLLMKDNLHAKSLSEFNSPAIVFNYAVPEPITYIEIVSDRNVNAEVSLSYQNDLVSGTVTSITETDMLEQEQFEIVAPAFSVEISIYGFKDTVLNVNPSFLLNRNTKQTEVMQIISPEYDEEYSAGEQYETIRKFDDVSLNNSSSNANNIEDVEENEKEEEESQNNEDDTISNFANDMEDKLIEIGSRQQDDKLLYETFQTSTEASSQPMDHTVVFYYIDSNFISQVKFIIYGHYSGKSITSMEYKPPVVVYSHFSPNSLKATITDFNTTSLFVHMFVFGYSPDDVTMDYVPFLRSSSQMAGGGNLNGIVTESPLERLKLLMKSKSNADIDSQKETDDGEPTLANNRLSITDDNAVVCAQTSTTSAAPNSYILRSMQTNAVFNLLLLLLAMTQAIVYA